ncbi:hypothetical protein LTR56_011464 [Elasticomyces elasticus]|nr:hypothetical protein LTR56_011464 [Elasticomyces elasticus]KAK4921441.1 hypothetical protein LTR49_011095 [Elasticomyces elasticus]KAK5760087.1 hypothetical protein LTS12_009818 [Elasticomyces elasticus]
MATSTEATTSSAPVISLFKLPAELRLQIYGYIFPVIERRDIETHSSNSGRATLDPYAILTPIMRVSSSLREDAMELYQQHLGDVQKILDDRQEDLRREKWAALEASDILNRGKVTGTGIETLIEGLRQQSNENCKWVARIEQVAVDVERVVDEVAGDGGWRAAFPIAGVAYQFLLDTEAVSRTGLRSWRVAPLAADKALCEHECTTLIASPSGW